MLSMYISDSVITLCRFQREEKPNLAFQKYAARQAAVRKKTALAASILYSTPGSLLMVSPFHSIPFHT